uniref:Uncharacterized protein n=1 Tax=Anguilla anguilla TaxID=7936 RepID=A0A0E9QZF7_ANGAN
MPIIPIKWHPSCPIWAKVGYDSPSHQSHPCLLVHLLFPLVLWLPEAERVGS